MCSGSVVLIMLGLPVTHEMNMPSGPAPAQPSFHHSLHALQ